MDSDGLGWTWTDPDELGVNGAAGRVLGGDGGAAHTII
jgi:hypothetical protein